MSQLAQTIMIALMILTVLVMCVDPAIAWAAGKKGKADLQTELDTLSQDLTPLSRKAVAKGFFSPVDAGKVLDIKIKMLELMKQNPGNELLLRPAYESAKLFRAREMYDDAFDFFNFIKTNFPDSPYAIQSSVEMQRMKEILGDSYFAETKGGGKKMVPAGR